MTSTSPAIPPVATAPDLRLVRNLCVLAGLAGTCTLVIGAASSTPAWQHPWESLLFGLGIAGLQVVPLRVSHEGQGEYLYLEETFLVPMALYLTPAEVLAVLALAVLVGQVWHRRSPLKAAFNVGEMVTAAGVGLAVSRLFGAGAGDLGNGALLAGALAGLVYAIVSMLLVAGVITAAQRGSFVDILRDGMVVRLGTWSASLAFGVLLAVALDGHLWLLALMAAPVAMFQVAYARALSQFSERHKIESLYNAAGSIRSSMNSRQVVAQLLASAQRLLDATEARLVPTTSPAVPGALRSVVDATVSVEVPARIAGGPWEENDEGLLRALASVASSALGNATMFERLQAVTASLAEGVVSLDERGLVTFANPAAGRLLGLESDRLIDRPLHEVVHPLPADRVAAGHECRLSAALAAGVTARDNDDVFTRADGSLLDVAVTISPVVGDDGTLGMVMAFRDITERKAFEEELSHRMFHDGLTGLANRALFADRLVQAHARALRNQTPFGVLFIDLDRFKVVNDSLGHHAGDELLKAVAERLKAKVRPGDTFARFGGDEFVMLLEDLSREDDATLEAQRVLDDLRAPFRIQDRDVQVSASVGVVVGDADHAAPEDCLRDADVAMYRAKANGKGRFEVFRPGTETGEVARLDREIALRLAIERGELEVHYQPIVAVDEGLIVGLEALVRWHHPVDGLVPPNDFIPLAEETGLILPLGRWVLEESCRQLQEWTAAIPALGRLVVSVNLSPHQFRQEGLGDQVGDILASTGLAPNRLCLEVTESALMSDTAATAVMLNRLKALGARLSIDDFGTGYSSLSYLKRFPVDYVKIDRAFVADLASDLVDSEIVRAVVRLANAIGIKSVAEGVEDGTQLSILKDLGCPLVQGYYLARPQPAAAIGTLLRAPFTMPGSRLSATSARPS